MGVRVSGSGGAAVPGLRIDDAPRTPASMQAQAADTQRERPAKAEVPDAYLQLDAAKSPKQRAAEGQRRVDDAVAQVDASVDQLIVTGADTEKALRALQGLRPDELDKAIYSLEQRGSLERLVDKLEPQQLVDLTRALTRSSVFQWRPAVDAAGKEIPGGPKLLRQGGLLPPSLKALAHDINLAIAKQHPAAALCEPGGTGEKLDVKEHHLFDWNGGVSGAAQTFVNRYLAATDVDASVHQLQKGDSWRVSTDASVKVGVGAGAEVSAGPALSTGIEVVRGDDGRFTVAADGSLLAMLSAEAGGPGLASVKAQLGAGGGGRVELSFATADQASQAAQLMLEAASSPVRFAAHLAVNPGAAKLLADNLSAVELGPQAAAKLGVEKKRAGGKTDGAELGGSAGSTVRLELKGGEVTGVSVKSSLRFDSSISRTSSLGHGLTLDSSKTMGVGVRADLEQRVELKPGAKLEDGVRQALQASGSLTIGLESKAGSAFSEQGRELEFKLTGEPNVLLQTMTRLQSGDLAGAADAVAKMEVTSRKTASTGVSLGVGLETGGDGASLSMRAARKRQLSKATEEGTGREYALRALASLTGAPKPGEAQPVQLPTVRD